MTSQLEESQSDSEFSLTEPFVLLWPSIDWMPATHFREGNLLYSNSISMLVSSKNTFIGTSRIIFNPISGPSQVDKINHYTIDNYHILFHARVIVSKHSYIFSFFKERSISPLLTHLFSILKLRSLLVSRIFH